MTLAVQPVTNHWNAKQFDEMSHYFTSLDGVSLTTDLSVVTDLQMTPQGRVLNRDGVPYTFTSQSLQQVCKLMSPGLFQTLSSISGQFVEVGESVLAYDIRTAADIFNRVLGLRFDTRFTHGMQILWNERDKLIEGVVGVRYVQLPNTELINLASSAAADMSPALVFQDAWQQGRRLVLRYVSPTPAFDVMVEGKRDTWYGGLHFENSEGGDRSFTVLPLLWHAASGSYTVDGRKSRSQHSGRSFIARVRQVLARALVWYEKQTELRQFIQPLVTYEVPVHNVNVYADPELRQFIDKLVKETSWLRSIAKKCVQSALVFGPARPDVNELVNTGRFVERLACTGYDLLLQMLYFSGSASLSTKIQLEQLSRLLPFRILDKWPKQ